MGYFRDWRRRRILQRHAPPPALWAQVLAEQPVLHGLAAAELEQLRELATLFLHDKSLEPMHGLQVDDAMRWTIAALAALPVLQLGIHWYDGWRSLVLYPDEFVTRHEWMDEDGLVHSRREILSGEAWERGPMVLSWADVDASWQLDGYNTVIHECAHKLDVRNGSANGQPPLHAGMDAAAWQQTWMAAYENFARQVDAGRETALDPYAAESPGEFFAVLSEYFFELPALLAQQYPEIYRLLAQFYRQQPLTRLGS